MTFLSPRAQLVTAAVLAIVVIPLAVHSAHKAAAATAVAVAETQTARAETAVAIRASQAAQARAAVYDSASKAAEARAAGATRRADEAVTRYKIARATSPDTCSLLAVAADTAIAAEAAIAPNLQNALQNEQKRGDILSGALGPVTAAAGHLRAASGTLVTASKPSILSRLTPRLGFGAAAGIDVLGRPDALIGITLGWSF